MTVSVAVGACVAGALAAPAAAECRASGVTATLSDGRLVVLEFQGAIEGMLAPGAVLGELEHAPGSSDATFVIGTQRLAGRVVRLKHPLAVLELEAGAAGAAAACDVPPALAPAADEPHIGATPSAPTRSLRVAQIIADKIVFDTRPTTVFE